MMPDRRSCISPMATWLPFINPGTGHPHICAPMEKYMRIRRKIRDQTSRFFSIGVLLSRSASSSAAMRWVYPAADEAFLFFTAAPYPAFSTACMTSPADAVPSTPIEFVRRLTEQEVTPGTLLTAFSTLAWHAAQLMPVTVYCSIDRSYPESEMLTPAYFISFGRIRTSSSTLSSLPFLISSVTQVLM